MDIFSILAESQIRAWQQRKDAGEDSPAPPLPAERVSLEGQLLTEIRALLGQAANATEQDREQLLREASQLEIRLMVLLESNGLPLVAQRISKELRALRPKPRQGS